MTFVAQILSFVSIVWKWQETGITCDTNHEKGYLRFRITPWMRKTPRQVGGLIRATLYPQHDPPKLYLCLPKLLWKAHSWFGQLHPTPAYYCADKEKNGVIQESKSQSTETHFREGRCADFSIFFPFFTFRRDNIATIDRNGVVFSSRFWKSSLC